ncbi:HD domain-containing phosphohydrolase [candidate division KSB1 bacterium]
MRQTSITKKLLIADSLLNSRLLDKISKENIIIEQLTDLYEKGDGIILDIYLLSENYIRNNSDSLKKLKNGKTSGTSLIFSIGNSPQKGIHGLIDRFIPEPVHENFVIQSLRSGYQALQQKFEAEYLKKELAARDEQLQQLAHVGQLLMIEKDTHTLLNLILQKSREMTNADAGSIYLVEKAEDEKPHLRFMLTHNDSVSFTFQEFTMPISRESISGFVADTGTMLNLPDVYNLPADSEFSINKSFDEKIGYRTKSMLVIPLINHRDEVIGVIQLINRKTSWSKRLKVPEDFEKEVVPFTGSCVEMLRALAGHAAVSIENSLLYQSIERLFEGFVNASVTAIESRDPTTSGHSSRVAQLTVSLAKKIDAIKIGPLRQVTFTRDQMKEIRYASLLHDFGKVGVRENVLLKAKKLYPFQLEELRYRIELIRKTKEIESLKKRLEYLQHHGNKGYSYRYHELDAELKRNIDELEYVRTIIESTNEPTVLHEHQAEALREFTQIKFNNYDNIEQPLIRPEEYEALSIGRGSLDDHERIEIESHVTHTFNFLKQVPWTSDIKNIPEIAYKHHEKLNGVGYPNKIISEEIPIQSKMMTISDIFDALTASDRPYKKAVPFDRALTILQYEVEDNHIDENLLKVFVEAEIYKLALKS